MIKVLLIVKEEKRSLSQKSSNMSEQKNFDDISLGKIIYYTVLMRISYLDQLLYICECIQVIPVRYSDKDGMLHSRKTRKYTKTKI